MSADLNLRVLTDGDTRGLDRTARALDDVADEADRAKKSTKGLGEESEKAGKKTEEMGRKSKRSGQDIVDLDKRIVELKNNLKVLAAEAEKTGKVNITKLKADSRELSGLERIKKQIQGLTEETLHWSQRIDDVIFKLPGLSAMASNPGIVGAGAALAIPAGAAVGGATLAAGGIAGAGIAAAAAVSADPAKVGAAWTSEIDKIKAKWAEAGKAAVDPTIAAIHVLGKDIQDIGFDRIIGRGAQYLEPLARAAGSALRYIGAGVETLVDSAGPEMEVLAQEVPEVGRAIKTALEEISSGSEGGADGLRDLLHVTEGVIVGTGAFIGGLETAYHWLGKASDAAHDLAVEISPFAREMNDLLTSGDGDVLAHRFKEASDAAGDATFTFNGLNIELYNTRDAADATNAAFKRLFDEEMNSAQAHVATQQGLIQLKETLKEHRGALNDVTEAGLANEAALLRQAELYARERDAAIEAGNGTKEATDAANEAYRRNIEGLIKIATQFGISEQAARNFLSVLLGIPDEVNTNINTYYHDYYSSSNAPIGPEERKYGPQGHARGTPSAPAGWAWVGEEGPELMNFRGGERVYDSPTSMRMASAAPSAPLAGGPTGMQVMLVAAPGADGAVAELINRLAREGFLQIKASAVV